MTKLSPLSNAISPLQLLQPKINGMRSLTIGAAVSVLCGCSLLIPANSPPPKFYSFDVTQPQSQPLTQGVPAVKVRDGAPTVALSIPRAAAGFDGHQIIYIRQSHQLEYFRQSEWIDSPASMLSPIIATALERTGQFAAVVQMPSGVTAQLRLDVEIVRLQHEFLSIPSRAHITLRAHLIDAATRQVVAWREFDYSEAANSDDPYGGVLATNRAVRRVAEELAAFCAAESNNYSVLPTTSISVYKPTK